MQAQDLEELEFWADTRVSYKHRLYQEAVKKAFEALDYNVILEKSVGEGGFVDVAAYPKGAVHKPTAIRFMGSTQILSGPALHLRLSCSSSLKLVTA